MSNLSTEREIAKFFAMSSVNIRPDACSYVLDKIQKYSYVDEKRQFLGRFLKCFKEWQTLNEKRSNLLQMSSTNSVLEQDTAMKIFSTMNVNTSSSR